MTMHIFILKFRKLFLKLSFPMKCEVIKTMTIFYAGLTIVIVIYPQILFQSRYKKLATVSIVCLSTCNVSRLCTATFLIICD